VSWRPFDEDNWEEGDAERGDAAPDGFEPFVPGAWADEDEPELSGRWPLDPRGLVPRERWQWYEQLWSDVCMLRTRYRLGLRAGWWEDEVQVEALAALAAWVERYDSGEWDDPPGKLALLYDLERVSLLLRDGLEPFYPDRDRAEFLRHLLESGAQPPPQAPPVG
jgi:hypothetical protein